jgi:hypothetical protein
MAMLVGRGQSAAAAAREANTHFPVPSLGTLKNLFRQHKAELTAPRGPSEADLRRLQIQSSPWIEMRDPR